jgi:hypothetical protein
MIAAANHNTFLIREPADEYHAQSRDYLSSHQLAEFRRCPELYHRRKLGLLEDVDRPAYVLGRAAHVLILEGLDAFDTAFAVGGPVNPKTGQPFGANTKTWAEWADAQGKDVLSTDQFDVISRMTQAGQMHPLATTLLAEGTAEGVVRADYRSGSRSSMLAVMAVEVVGQGSLYCRAANQAGRPDRQREPPGRRST